MRLPLRRRVAGRRGRRSAARRRLLTATRLAGVVAMALSAAAWTWVTDPTHFTLEESRIELGGLLHTDRATVRQQIGLPIGSQPNVFTLRTTDMEQRLRQLPAVASADVRAVLPDGLVVEVTERVPLFVWRTADAEFLVDATGTLVGPPLADAPGVDELPVVDDERRSDASVDVGDVLDATDLAVMLRLAALTPALVGSAAEQLAVSVDDEDGYVVTAVPPSWRATFGHYTPTLRTPEIIDQQVQCLRSLLAEEGEAAVADIRLAVADDRCGSYRPRPTPRQRPSPAATAEPAESPAP